MEVIGVMIGSNHLVYALVDEVVPYRDDLVKVKMTMLLDWPPHQIVRVMTRGAFDGQESYFTQNVEHVHMRFRAITPEADEPTPENVVKFPRRI